MSRSKRGQQADVSAKKSGGVRAASGGVQVQSFSGPLPPPKVLESYEAIVPGAAERILKMAEDQASHRRRLERVSLEGKTALARTGQILAFVLALVALVGGFYMVSIGKDAAGIASVIGAVGSLLGAFLWGKWQDRKEREAKQAALDGRG